MTTSSAVPTWLGYFNQVSGLVRSFPVCTMRVPDLTHLDPGPARRQAPDNFNPPLLLFLGQTLPSLLWGLKERSPKHPHILSTPRGRPDVSPVSELREGLQRQVQEPSLKPHTGLAVPAGRHAPERRQQRRMSQGNAVECRAHGLCHRTRMPAASHKASATFATLLPFLRPQSPLFFLDI